MTRRIYLDDPALAPGFKQVHFTKDGSTYITVRGNNELWTLERILKRRYRKRMLGTLASEDDSGGATAGSTDAPADDDSGQREGDGEDTHRTTTTTAGAGAGPGDTDPEEMLSAIRRELDSDRRS